MSSNNDMPRNDQGDRDIAQLISSAGPRPRLTELESARLRRAATAAWEAEVHRRQVRRRAAVSAMAASFVAGLAVAWWFGGTPQVSAPGPVVAEVLQVVGTLEVVSADGEASTLRTGHAVRRGDRLDTASTGAAALAMANGMHLRLAGGSGLVVESVDGLRLAGGRLYADSGATVDATRSLTVHTAEAVVRDIGTRFQVIASPGRTRVLVRDGEVRVRSETGEAAAYAGDAIAVTGDGSMVRARVTADDPDWDWTQRVAVSPDIEGRPVIELLRWVAHETGKTLVFADERVEADAGTILLSGSIRGLTPLESLDVMLRATDLGYTLTASGSIVVSRRPR